MVGGKPDEFIEMYREPVKQRCRGGLRFQDLIYFWASKSAMRLVSSPPSQTLSGILSANDTRGSRTAIRSYTITAHYASFQLFFSMGL